MIFISSVQSLSHAQLFATTWTAAHQASPSITNSWTLLKVMSIELVMPSNHLILCQMAADKRNRNLQLNPTPRYAELGRASLELVGHRQNEVVPWPCEGKEMQRWRRVFRDSSQSRDQTHVSVSPALASGFFTTSTAREALWSWYQSSFFE